MLCSAPPRAEEIGNQWSRVSEFYFRNDNAHGRGDVFVNTYTGVHRPETCKAAEWCAISVARYGVPSDAKVVFLSGLLIITHGSTAETADLLVGFRAFGDTNSLEALRANGGTWYLGQSVETSTSGGQRSTIATWVPVRDGKFEFRYEKSTPGAWPANSAYGVNLTIQAWGR